jgi:hypothetical protein
MSNPLQRVAASIETRRVRRALRLLVGQPIDGLEASGNVNAAFSEEWHEYVCSTVPVEYGGDPKPDPHPQLEMDVSVGVLTVCEGGQEMLLIDLDGPDGLFAMLARGYG